MTKKQWKQSEGTICFSSLNSIIPESSRPGRVIESDPALAFSICHLMTSSADYARYDDERLISLIAQLQTGALDQLYDRYNRPIFSLALMIVGDRATAEEITLDVFMRVWQKAGSYRADQARVSTWLTHIARHHAIDVLSRRAV